MRKHVLRWIGILAMLMATFAIPQRAAADDDDPPTRVARLSQVDGSVSFEPAGTEDWVTAEPNRPMTTGDKLWADRDSRAELRIGSASIRLGASTGFSFLNLDDRTVQLQLTEGTLRIRVHRLDRDDIFEVDTPNLAFNVSRPGVYRITVNEAGDATTVAVRDGEGEVTGGGQSYSVRAGETGNFSGTDQLNADIEGVGTDDDLDRWSQQRDQRDDHSTARRYVSDDVVGYEDLDEHGGWRDVPEYGTVWFPRVSQAGWAPYRYGHWVWIAPWGYTWVDDEPWGFAPFHYGRWVAVGGAWGWVPCRPREVVGVAYVRPVYAPALVAWVGGSGFAVGVAVGGASNVGWFPLGPREVYVPSYRVSRNYVTNVNVSNTVVNTTVVNNYYNTTVVNKTTVNNVTYVNQRVPGAVTATSTRAFTSAQPVSRNVVRVDERAIVSAPVAVRTPAVAPERQAFVGGGRPVSARPPERIVTRAVVARTAPPPPPAPVERQQAAIRQSGGQPVPPSQMRQIQQQQAPQARVAAVKMAPPARPAEPRRGGQPGNAQPGNRPANAAPNAAPNNAPANRPAENVRPGNERPANERPSTAQPNPNTRPNTPPNAAPNNPPPNRPADNARPGNERNDRPATAQPNPNARPNTPPNNTPPNRPADNARPGNERNDRPATPQPNPNARPNTPPNTPPNRPADNARPGNERNDRPPSARPANPPSADRPQQQQRTEPPPRQQERTEPPPRQQERPQPPPREQERTQPPPRQEERPQPPPRQQERAEPPPRQQERPQPPPRQQERTEPPPRQQERTQPPPRQQERPQPPPRQQERPKQQDKPKEKEKDKDKPPKS